MPEEFLSLLKDRQEIDDYQKKHYRTEGGTAPRPRTTFPSKSRSAAGLRIFHSQPTAEELEFRKSNRDRSIPNRGFIAPILGGKSVTSAGAGPLRDFRKEELSAARFIQEQLAGKGLIRTALECIRILGPERIQKAPGVVTEMLCRLGLPVDLLRYFRPSTVPADQWKPGVEQVLMFLAATGAVEAGGQVQPQMVFEFTRTNEKFRIATEAGEHALGMLRFQIQGGWSNGLIPGGNIDVVGQLLESFRNADYLVSTSEEIEPLVSGMARNVWRWRRANQLSLCVETIGMGGWAQDNAKGGYLSAEGDEGSRWATLTPRYASTQEGLSAFSPGDSYLMDGLAAAGQTVLQSPLLFQGGNLLATTRGSKGNVTLWIGAGEIERNRALGLSESQILRSFQIEFGVNHCEVLPAVSYHLDYDVSFRVEGTNLLAFVNDVDAAAKIVVNLGIDALEKSGGLDTVTADDARRYLKENRPLAAVRSIGYILPVYGSKGTQPGRPVIEAFVVDGVDDAAGNLDVFRVGLDLLESSETGSEKPTIAGERDVYLRALRAMRGRCANQAARLAELGCKVVRIPSMPDLNRSINYINSIQCREGVVMPVFGGFYSELDHAALAAYAKVLGGNVRLFPIQCAELQRKQGGVHCVASVYPALEP